MITGAHVMIFTKDEAADRAFLRDVLEIPCIDSGGGWLIFTLPPAELGVHSRRQRLPPDLFHLRRRRRLRREDGGEGRRDRCRSRRRIWGRSTGVTLPGGGKLGIYQATHAQALAQRDHDRPVIAVR